MYPSDKPFVRDCIYLYKNTSEGFQRVGKVWGWAVGSLVNTGVWAEGFRSDEGSGFRSDEGTVFESEGTVLGLWSEMNGFRGVF